MDGQHRIRGLWGKLQHGYRFSVPSSKLWLRHDCLSISGMYRWLADSNKLVFLLAAVSTTAMSATAVSATAVPATAVSTAAVSATAMSTLWGVVGGLSGIVLTP